MKKETKNAADAVVFEGETLSSELKVGRLLRDIQPGMETILDLVDDLADGKKITVIQREVNPEPPVERQVARRPKRNFTFHDMSGFMEYIQKNSTDNSIVLADAMQHSAVFVYDERSENDYEIATFRPCLHPLLIKWMGLKMPAKDFALFVMENRSSIVGGMIGETTDGTDTEEMITARQIAMLFRQVRTSKSVTIESGVGPKTINGVMVEVKIGASTDIHQIAMELPDRIKIRVPMFVHSSDEIEFDFDLLVFNNSDDRPYVSATNSEIQTAIAKQFASDIERLEGVIPVVALGTYETAPWKLVV